MGPKDGAVCCGGASEMELTSHLSRSLQFRLASPSSTVRATQLPSSYRQSSPAPQALLPKHQLQSNLARQAQPSRLQKRNPSESAIAKVSSASQLPRSYADPPSTQLPYLVPNPPPPPSPPLRPPSSNSHRRRPNLRACGTALLRRGSRRRKRWKRWRWRKRR